MVKSNKFKRNKFAKLNFQTNWNPFFYFLCVYTLPALIFFFDFSIFMEKVTILSTHQSKKKITICLVYLVNLLNRQPLPPLFLPVTLALWRPIST